MYWFDLQVQFTLLEGQLVQEEWRFYTVDHGEVSVTMIGTTRMQMLFVECWDSGKQMSKWTII